MLKAAIVEGILHLGLLLNHTKKNTQIPNFNKSIESRNRLTEIRIFTITTYLEPFLIAGNFFF